MTEDGMVEKWKDDGLVKNIGEEVIGEIKEKIDNYKESE